MDLPSPSTALTTNVVGFRDDSTAIEQLRAEIDRIRQAAALDVQNLQNDLIAKNREIGRLKAELAKTREEEPEHDEVRELLLLWKALTERNGKTDIKTGGKRYGLVKAGLKRWGRERCEHALRGLALKPYSGQRGRSSEQYLGSKKVCDVVHALGDEERFERCEQYWLEHLNPSLLDQPVEPEPAPVVPIAPRRKRERAWDDIAPIDKILRSLNACGCDWRATANVDQWIAQCPAHEDRNPSLSIMRKSDGMLLLHCWAGCDTADVLHAMDREFRDLWTGGDRDYERADGQHQRKVVPAHLRQAMRQLIELEERAA